jgi:hypothetical protein
MKKLITLTLLTGAFVSIVPAAMADNAMFLKKLKICGSYSYAYGYENGKALTRKLSGTQPIPSGLGCFFTQDMPGNKTITCKFPVPEMRSVTSAFSSGNENALLKNYIDSGVCEEK